MAWMAEGTWCLEVQQQQSSSEPTRRCRMRAYPASSLNQVTGVWDLAGDGPQCMQLQHLSNPSLWYTRSLTEHGVSHGC